MRLFVSLFLFFILMMNQGFSQQDKKYPLKVSLTVLKKENYNKPKSINLKITVTNTSDTAFSFYMMTCGWDGIFKFSPIGIYRNLDMCLQNFPTEITLEPKKSEILFDNFSYDKKMRDKSIPVKIGLRVVKDTMPNFNGTSTQSDTVFIKKISNYYNKLMKKLEYCESCKKEEYIWSKPVLIKFD